MSHKYQNSNLQNSNQSHKYIYLRRAINLHSKHAILPEKSFQKDSKWFCLYVNLFLYTINFAHNISNIIFYVIECYRQVASCSMQELEQCMMPSPSQCRILAWGLTMSSTVFCTVPDDPSNIVSCTGSGSHFRSLSRCKDPTPSMQSKSLT